ncbi:MAG TPA: AMP-binding protein [Streptosporangiaceae bacterium]|nr:AMP-binding protein [Streptosporangiaceae bacterium]
MTTVDDYAGTIPGLLAAAAERNAEGTWLRSDSGSLTFGAAVAVAGRTAGALQELGVRRGDLVMMTARNTPPFLASWLALASLGALTVAVNPRGSAAELAGLIGQTQPRLIITDAGLAGTVAEAVQAGAGAGPQTADVTSLVPGDWADAGAMARAARDGRLPEVAIAPADPAVLIPTSGTTGRSKLVVQTHRAYAMAGEGFPFWMELTADDRMMTSLPLFHVNAPAYSVMGSLACGAGLVLLERFSASGFLDAARRHGATEFNAIGAMLEILMRQPERPDDASTPLRLCYTGPAPERERQLEMEQRLGLRIVVGYAMSESPYGLIWAHGTRPYGTLGSPRQHPVLGLVNHARVVSESGAELGPGDSGELLLRNPVVTPGYFQMPEETARVITADGWLHTGDLVTVNADGTYTFVSRIKEVIRRRGENLSPLEVEEVLAEHPSVLECAVVGVPSDLTEEEVKAFIVAADGRQPDFAELRDFAAARLAAFKVPRYWQLIDVLPRTPTSRVAKHRLPEGHPPGEWDAAAAPSAAAGPGLQETTRQEDQCQNGQ